MFCGIISGDSCSPFYFVSCFSDLPPADWNLSEQLRFFEELVPSLVLPEFPLDKLDSDDWKTACSVVQSYIHGISDDSANCSEFFAK